MLTLMCHMGRPIELFGALTSTPLAYKLGCICNRMIYHIRLCIE